MDKDKIWICQDADSCDQFECAWKHGVGQKCDHYLRAYHKNSVVFTSGKENIKTIPLCGRSLSAIPYKKYLIEKKGIE